MSDRHDGLGEQMVSAAEQQKWPDTLWIVRHGESAGNVARELLAEIPTLMAELSRPPRSTRKATLSTSRTS